MTLGSSEDELPPSHYPHGERFARIAVTITTSLIATAAFSFSFRNTWVLALSLGVDRWAAPLTAPAVDLSVVGLLVALWFLAQQGTDRGQLRGVRWLMRLCGALTLGLNVAGAVAAGKYGRAGFDAVAPSLLIGWGECGPTLLAAIYSVRSTSIPDISAGLVPEPAMQEVPEIAADVPEVPPTPTRTRSSGVPSRGTASRSGATRYAADEALLEAARELNEAVINETGRPASVRRLKSELRIGQVRATELRNRLSGVAARTSTPTSDVPDEPRPAFAVNGYSTV